MQPSPTGSGAPYWRIHCGSFAAYGSFGAAEDLMLRMFITCANPPETPTRIVMGSEVFQSWCRAQEQYLQFLVRHIRRILDDPTDWMKNVAVAKLDSSAEILRSLRDLERAITDRRDRYMGAEVVHDRNLAEGTVLFYVGEKLVGECAGWTP
jgi:hypothetical protein